ncbi:MAG: type IV pilus modification PilV family protein [Candidatus Rifleibacteriota bacterium]
MKKNGIKKGFSLVEVMVSLFIFGIMFAAIFKAFAPTATDSHNLLRGYSFAMNLANRHICKIEAEIERFGLPENLPLNEFKDITGDAQADNTAIELLKNLLVRCRVTPGEVEDPALENLFKIEIEVNWGNNDHDKRPHQFKLARWKVRPCYD